MHFNQILKILNGFKRLHRFYVFSNDCNNLKSCQGLHRISNSFKGFQKFIGILQDLMGGVP